MSEIVYYFCQYHFLQQFLAKLSNEFVLFSIKTLCFKNFVNIDGIVDTSIAVYQPVRYIERSTDKKQIQL